MPGRKLDLTGMRFGKLIVIEIAGKDKIGRYMWKCQCDCELETVVGSQSLIMGNTKSCGCLKRERKNKKEGNKERRQNKNSPDLVGQRFERLLVLEKIREGKYIFWLCKCDCGKNTIVSTQSLRNGNTKSCGCYKIEVVRRGLESGEAAFNSLWSVYNAGAKGRELEFLLSKEYFKELTQSNCFYCGRNPEQIIGNSFGNGSYTYNGIDRINNKVGYVFGNVVPCCGKCNSGKSKMTQEEFLSWIKSIYEHSILPIIGI